MTKKDKKNQLAKYRLKQAEESIDEAVFLLSGDKSPRSVINQHDLCYSGREGRLSPLQQRAVVTRK